MEPSRGVGCFLCLNCPADGIPLRATAADAGLSQRRHPQYSWDAGSDRWCGFLHLPDRWWVTHMDTGLLPRWLQYLSQIISVK